MVKFLTTTGISHELEEIIKGAQQELTLVSPYIKVNQRLLDFIKDVNQRGVPLTIVYGKRDLRAGEKEWVDQLVAFETGFVENLHAKCYLNENTAIITSMNLYEFSQQNNDEIGIRVDSKEDLNFTEKSKRKLNACYEKQLIGKAESPPQLRQLNHSRKTTAFASDAET